MTINTNFLKKRFNKHPKSLHLWFPDIFQFKGGIQVYSAFLLEALQKLYPQIEYNVFLKHDSNCPENLSFLKNIYFHFSGNWNQNLRTWVFAIQLLVFAINKPPNLIISSHINFGILAYYLNYIFGIPYWIVVHGVDVWNISNPNLIKALLNADRIISVSNYTKERLLKEQNIDPIKISILPNTFDHNQFCIAEKSQYLIDRYGLTRDQPIILTVSRLSRCDGYKGYDQILQILPLIRKEIPNIHYLLVGKGDDQARIIQLINELNLQDCVTLTGFVSDHEICDHYNLCDVFAMPSQGEGFGIVYLEALACGKPVLGGNQDGAIDALCHGELGALVDPNDKYEIARTLIAILEGDYPNSLIYQPEALRERVIEYFGFDQFTKTISKLIINSPLCTYI
jgi:glycosyltransferase involved in cell wall biosynthesis